MKKAFLPLLALFAAAPAAAQGPRPSTLSLEEALDLARKNNPGYQVSVNSRHRSETALRSAYGTLMPRANTSLSAGYRQGKPEYFSGVSFGANSDVVSSAWGLSFNYAITAGALPALRASQANLDAADNDVEGAGLALRTGVASQYLLVLQLQARAALQDSLVSSNQLQLTLARAKEGVGSATTLDVKRAEVALGQQQVAVLRAHNLADVSILQLFQQIGIPMPGGDVRLTSTFTVTEPTVQVDALLAMARQGNPTLKSLQARERSANSAYTATRSLYTPTLSASASFGGTTQKYTDGEYLVQQGMQSTLQSRAGCFTTDSLRRGAGMPSIGAACGAIAFTDADAARLRAENNVWPFKFTSNPYNLSLSLSLPLFDGFVREQRLEDASAGRADARYNVRAQELKLVADVTAAYTTLVADFRTFRLQEQNAQAAREALLLAQERYRVGLNSLVDLQQARGDFERAETDRIDALFEYHRAFAALEGAVGRTLR